MSVKQGFDRFMAKADGQDEYQNIKAAQKKARTELTQKIQRCLLLSRKNTVVVARQQNKRRLMRQLTV